MHLYDPHAWQPFSVSLAESLSPLQSEWLQHSGSLTHRLRKLTNNKIEHHLLFNDWENDQRLCWIRKMEWRYEGEVWFYCVVSLPKEALVNDLEDIGRRSIGDILFADPDLKRSEFLTQKYEGYYSRRSIFLYQGHEIEIVEVFFPEFFEFVK